MKRFHKLSAFGFLFLLLSCVHKDKKSGTAIETKTNTSDTISRSSSLVEKTNASTLLSFIPANYSILDTATGNLNLDEYPDIILILKKNDEEKTSDVDNHPEKRPLLILIGQPDHTLKLVAKNDNSVYCVDYGGIMGDPFDKVVIKKGYFSIEHAIMGGPQHWEEITTFKYDKMKTNWYLYKTHYTDYIFNPSNDPNAEALIVGTDKLRTAKDFGEIPFDQFDIYADDKDEEN